MYKIVWLSEAQDKRKKLSNPWYHPNARNGCCYSSQVSISHFIKEDSFSVRRPDLSPCPLGIENSSEKDKAKTPTMYGAHSSQRNVLKAEEDNAINQMQAINI
jgi:hypothetical protein